MHAPTSRPPFEPPTMAILSGLVYLLLIRYSAADIKSLNTYYGDIDNIFILYTFTHYTYAVALLKYSLSLITGCGLAYL